MTSRSIIPEASTSTKHTNEHVFRNVEDQSTDKDAEKQIINNPKKMKEIGVVTDWLRMVEPRKVPYFPQKRDKIVYLRQAHECYLKEVTERNIFDVTESDKLWVEMEIDVFEYLTIINISFEKYPMRVAILEVRKIDSEEQETGPSFKLKYHNLGDVVEFLVLKHIFNEGLQIKWNVGDIFRCLVGNKWFFGTIVSKEPFEKKYPTSPFKSYKVKWHDENELDQLSPWELDIINKKRLPKNHGDYVEPLNIEIKRMTKYDTHPDDWKDGKTNIENISSNLELLMNLPISKCFIEIRNDPIYDTVVSYPIDLSTIKERLKYKFYRRIDSLLMDISYFKENAEKHKSEKFFKEATLIAEVCEDIVNKGECDSTSSFSNLGEFLANFNSSESDDDDNEYKPRKSYNKKGRHSNHKNDWKIECKKLLNILWNSEDMLPFRQPVCPEDYPDYYEKISSPICLEQINAKYHSKEYKSPKNLFDDIKLLIKNSREYNTDEDKAIYIATTRVSNLFDELKKKINYKKESPRKKFKKNINQNNKELVACREKPKNENVSTNQNNSIRDETTENEKVKNAKNNNYNSELDKEVGEVLKNNCTNQFNVNPKSLETLQSQRRGSTDSVIVIDDDKDDEEDQQVSQSFEKVNENVQSQVDGIKNSEKAVKTLQKKLNFRKLLASTKAKKMQLKYNRIFQPRPCTSCITCQNIKQIYLDHVKSKHFKE